MMHAFLYRRLNYQLFDRVLLTRTRDFHNTTIGIHWDSAATNDRPTWSEEWKALGLGATLRNQPAFPPHLFFVELGFGVDQHGDESDATKAAIRAVRNAIEFNSIPGVISHMPGGRANMLIHVKLGVPPIATAGTETPNQPMAVNQLEVAKVFPYGQLLPIEVTMGGLAFSTGRIVPELGDTNDVGVCVAACVSIGYENEPLSSPRTHHKTYSTKMGTS